MDWTRAVDGYCERLGPEFWSEPLNAVTNAAFVLAAVILWRRSFGFGRVLCAILAGIGVGSFLFHTVAQPWAGVADVVPILIFVLVYIYAANRDFWRLSVWPALGLTALFLPFAAVTAPLFGLIPGLGGTASYAPVPLLIAIYAVMLRHRAPDTARGLAIGVAILLVSMMARILDDPLCALLPIGTHFIWHLLNATMLGWMIAVWTRHVLAARQAGR
ncbi:ceramidase domain-containing protein [Antarctobacter heliothermus]|uniref:Ceramidase n=1 Tax=Antarctobacter heliothermus TaxID=74033 RepID=A0A239B6Q4_9RHOB|nr:ceramidase domain-containing protein [Antarctobacter heliothermus]SNS03565.1 Ceramidase [Antarctobacter heliothermus]